MANKIVILGCGGHFNSVLDTLLLLNCYDEIGYVTNDDDNNIFRGIRKIGDDSKLEVLYNAGWKNAFIAIGSTEIREEIAKKIIKIGFNVPNIIDVSAIVSKSSKLGKGIFVGKGAIINAGSKIDDFAIINTGSVVDHNCRVAKFVHISPNACLCGNCEVGENSHIGAGSVVKQGTNIGSHTMIGMGSVVTHNISSNVIAYGNPCKVVKKQ